VQFQGRISAFQSPQPKLYPVELKAAVPGNTELDVIITVYISNNGAVTGYNFALGNNLYPQSPCGIIAECMRQFGINTITFNGLCGNTTLPSQDTSRLSTLPPDYVTEATEMPTTPWPIMTEGRLDLSPKDIATLAASAFSALAGLAALACLCGIMKKIMNGSVEKLPEELSEELSSERHNLRMQLV
jgi:hypothetical protein